MGVLQPGEAADTAVISAGTDTASASGREQTDRQGGMGCMDRTDGMDRRMAGEDWLEEYVNEAVAMCVCWRGDCSLVRFIHVQLIIYFLLHDTIQEMQYSFLSHFRSF